MNFEWYRHGKSGDAKFYIHCQYIILVLKHIHLLHFWQQKANKSNTILSIFFCAV